MRVSNRSIKFKRKCPKCECESNFSWKELVDMHFCQICYYEFEPMKDGVTDK